MKTMKTFVNFFDGFFKNSLKSFNQIITIHKKFHENDFLKNQILPEYAGPLVKHAPTHFRNFSFLQKPTPQNQSKILQFI